MDEAGSLTYTNDAIVTINQEDSFRNETFDIEQVDGMEVDDHDNNNAAFDKDNEEVDDDNEDDNDDDDSDDDNNNDDEELSTSNDNALNDDTAMNNGITAKPSDLTGWSQYEIDRAKKVERNNARLRELGLISVKEQMEANAKAWKRQISSEKKAAPAKRSFESAEGARKSSRLRGSNHSDNKSSKKNKSSSPHNKLKMNHFDLTAPKYHSSWKPNDVSSGNYSNKTDTPLMYEHCLMRVQSMTHQQLKNRIRVIENAAGKQCILKLAMTACCLEDEGLYDLALLAKQALERVKALQQPPPPMTSEPPPPLLNSEQQPPPQQ